MTVRVLVVDDSVVIRRMVSDLLAGEPGIEVVGSAADGRIALAKLPLLRPDVMTLDVEMPNLDGLGTLQALRDIPEPPAVIMFSTLTERGASVTLDALALGAADYVTKPTNSRDVAESKEDVRRQLVPKVLALGATRSVHAARVRMTAAAARPPAPAVVARPARTGPPLTPHAVVVAVSTGGPAALATVVPALPADLPVPVLVVQHMPPTFTRLLAERLDKQSAVRVQEVTEVTRLEAGAVYLAQGGIHLVARRSGTEVFAALDDGPPEESVKPAADVLFRSAADAWGGAVLAVVLTGMGQDGFAGATRLAGLGAQVIAQDQASSVVWGMPGKIVTNGLADAVLPLAAVAGEIVRRCTAVHAPRLQRIGTP